MKHRIAYGLATASVVVAVLAGIFLSRHQAAKQRQPGDVFTTATVAEHTTGPAPKAKEGMAPRLGSMDPVAANKAPDALGAGDETLAELTAEAELMVAPETGGRAGRPPLEAELILMEAAEIKERLLREARTDNERAMVRKSFEEHSAAISRYTRRLESEVEDANAAQILMDIATEYWHMFRKTPRRLAEQREKYLKARIDALEEAVRRGDVGVGAFYLAQECRMYHSSGFSGKLSDGKRIDPDLALHYYLLTYELLARSEAAQDTAGKVYHRRWLVRGTMEGIQESLKRLNRQEELPKMRSALLEKYKDTVLGQRLDAFYGANRN